MDVSDTRTFRHRIPAEQGLVLDGGGPNADKLLVSLRELLQQLAREKGHDSGDRLVVWTEDNLSGWEIGVLP